MDKLTVCETDHMHYSVRPLNWAGCWNDKGQIKESLNHLGVFLNKEDAENFAAWKTAQEERRLVLLPCALDSVVYEIGGELPIEKKQVESIEVDKYGMNIYAKDVKGSYETYTDDDFGTFVFTTQEDAENELKKGTE